MKKALIPLTFGLILGSAGWAEATPLSGPPLAPNHSLLETIGCTTAGDNCPYGYRIERHGGKGWSCKPCWDQKHGSRYRDEDHRYDEPRRHREYGDYGSRRSRDYDDNYEPRRYRDY
jgi:hypothetical protein